MTNEEKPLTLDDFNNQILRPIILNGIKNGKFDIVLDNEEELEKCIKIYAKDLGLIFAIVDRLRILGYKGY